VHSICVSLFLTTASKRSHGCSAEKLVYSRC
jgi:hypothetical protein